jgi:hypothetical protein
MRIQRDGRISYPLARHLSAHRRRIMTTPPDGGVEVLTGIGCDPDGTALLVVGFVSSSLYAAKGCPV